MVQDKVTSNFMDIFTFIQRFVTCVFKTVSLKGPNNQSLYAVVSTLPIFNDNMDMR